MTMPEEVNRMETDSIITLYFYQIATSSKWGSYWCLFIHRAGIVKLFQ